MTSARAGRRRRLLHEGANTAAPSVSSSSTDEAAPNARYALREDSVSARIAAGLAPSSAAAIAASTAVGGVMVAGLVAIDSYGLAAAAAGVPGGRLLLLDAVGSLAGWVASAAWLLVAGMSLVVFGLRRQRMDDVRCAYRWWVVGAVAATLLSANAATHSHQIVAGLLADATGFSPLQANAFWWIALGVPVFGLLALRLLMDASASRLAVLAGGVTLLVIGAGWTIESHVVDAQLAGFFPSVPWTLVGPGCVVAGPLLAIVSLLVVNRHILREAYGKVAAPKPRSQAKTKPQAKAKAQAKTKSDTSKTAKATNATAAETAPAEAAASSARSSAKANEPQEATPTSVAKPTIWTNGADGSDEYADDYDEDQPKRKLSKAERKRLRRQKARNAA